MRNEKNTQRKGQDVRDKERAKREAKCWQWEMGKHEQGKDRTDEVSCRYYCGTPRMTR
jgi:hypothetical protein